MVGEPLGGRVHKLETWIPQHPNNVSKYQGCVFKFGLFGWMAVLTINRERRQYIRKESLVQCGILLHSVS